MTFIPFGRKKSYTSPSKAVEVEINKTEKAIVFSKKKNSKINNLVIAGGVAANKKIKKSFVNTI